MPIHSDKNYHLSISERIRRIREKISGQDATHVDNGEEKWDVFSQVPTPPWHGNWGNWANASVNKQT